MWIKVEAVLRSHVRLHSKQFGESDSLYSCNLCHYRAIILCSGKDCRNISRQTLQTVCYEDKQFGESDSLDYQDFAVMSVSIANSSSTASTLIHIDIMITNILHS